VALKGKRQVAAVSSAECGSPHDSGNLLECRWGLYSTCADFSSWRNSPKLMRGAPFGAIGACHPSGWIQTHLFTQFTHSLHKLKYIAESLLLLTLDSHYSHSRNQDVLNLARENCISIVCIPPHALRKLQPQDISFISPPKSYHSVEVCLWMRTNACLLMNCDIAELFRKAYLKVQNWWDCCEYI
jgi:hypothetical protein